MMPLSELPENPRILFVDDEPSVLDGIRRNLVSHENEWEITFASNGRQALSLMSDRPADVVVTDMAMPCLDGRRLIERLAKTFPGTVPVVLSGHWNELAAFSHFGPKVHYLAKPVSHDQLISTIRQAIREVRSSSEGRLPREWIDNGVTGFPVVDAQHREINAYGNLLELLFSEDHAADALLPALTEYHRLLSNHFTLERALMEQLPQEKYQDHIFVHVRNHMDKLQFIEEAIRDITECEDVGESMSVIHIIFNNMVRNMSVDDRELYSLISKENRNCPGTPG